MRVLIDEGIQYRDPRTLDNQAFQVDYQGFCGYIWANHRHQGDVLTLARDWAVRWWVLNEHLVVDVPDLPPAPSEPVQLDLFGGAA